MYFTLNHVQNMFESQLWSWKLKWTILGPKANGKQQVNAERLSYLFQRPYIKSYFTASVEAKGNRALCFPKRSLRQYYGDFGGKQDSWGEITAVI